MEVGYLSHMRLVVFSRKLTWDMLNIDLEYVKHLCLVAKSGEDVNITGNICAVVCWVLKSE